MNKRTGFTLIELLVVVLIMGILASVAMPQYFKSVEKSRSSEAASVLSGIAASQERYFMQKGSYITAIGSLQNLDIGINGLSYFTVTAIGVTNTATRTQQAGGGLGEYTISLKIPNTPGTGTKTWSCSPSPACNSLLPQ